MFVPELDDTSDDAAEARRCYCGTVGAEFMHMEYPERRRWIQERLEGTHPATDQKLILEFLDACRSLRTVIQSRYLGTKRFSLEGVASLIPFLDQVFNSASIAGAEKAVLAMSHRGRLSVMVNIVGRSAADIFSKFEDVDPRSILGGGDVKYHVGATGDYATP